MEGEEKMRAADEFLTLSICIQFGIFLTTLALGKNNVWLNSNLSWESFIVILAATAFGVVALVAVASFFSGSGNAFVFMAGRLEMSAGFVAMVALYGVATAYTALVFLSLPWGLGTPVAGLYGVFAAVVIVWDVIDRAAPRGNSGESGGGRFA